MVVPEVQSAPYITRICRGGGGRGGGEKNYWTRNACGKIEKTGCEIVCGAPATVAVKGQTRMMTACITILT